MEDKSLDDLREALRAAQNGEGLEDVVGSNHPLLDWYEDNEDVVRVGVDFVVRLISWHLATRRIAKHFGIPRKVVVAAHTVIYLAVTAPQWEERVRAVLDN